MKTVEITDGELEAVKEGFTALTSNQKASALSFAEGKQVEAANAVLEQLARRMATSAGE